MASSEYWGLELQLDLDADPKTIRSEKELKRYVKELCNLIGVKRFGETTIVRFGKEKRVCGYSLVQLIETSLVSGHFAEETNRAYINIFSCKPFDINRALSFTSKFFKATDCQGKVSYRI